VGSKKNPIWRVVVADQRSPRDGRYIEIIGTYDPLTDPSTIVLNGDRAKHWLSVGAQPTERVVKLMAREGLIEAPSFDKPATAEAAAPAKEEAAVTATATAESVSDEAAAEEAE